MLVLDRVLHEVVFKLSSQHTPDAKGVVLVGSFNRWDSGVHRLVLGPDGWWSVTLTLGPGEYPYLFLVDGTPFNDPEEYARGACEWGGECSVRLVG
jgi:1,4-alpha-glucan branching enzyme